MGKNISIMLGGAIGAILRVSIRNLSIFQSAGSFPINTLIVNIIGCFFLAFIFKLAAEVIDIPDSLKAGLTTGLIGAFTTFSTLCKEVSSLIISQQYLTAGIYLLLSVVLGLLAAILADRFIELLFGTAIKEQFEED